MCVYIYIYKYIYLCIYIYLLSFCLSMLVVICNSKTNNTKHANTKIKEKKREKFNII